MMASGETARSGAEGERHRISQAKVPMSDETPKTGIQAGPKKQSAREDRAGNLSGEQTEACLVLARLRFLLFILPISERRRRDGEEDAPLRPPCGGGRQDRALRRVPAAGAIPH